MRKILSLTLSILFVVGIFFSVPMTASALNSGIEYIGTYEIEKQINPLYKGLIDESNAITNKPSVYYSDGIDDFDPALYSSDKEVSATAIREGMEDRLATVVVYYKTTTNLTDAELNELFSELQEMAFKETDVATQGDTLRLGYKSSAVYAQGPGGHFPGHRPDHSGAGHSGKDHQGQAGRIIIPSSAQGFLIIRIGKPFFFSRPSYD